MIRLRLQGGPHDGETRRVKDDYFQPDRIYVVRCIHCGSHWFPKPCKRAAVYRRDEEQGGCQLYVYTDLSLEPAPVAEREQAPARGWA